jgi:Tol biopolymer transport system component
MAVAPGGRRLVFVAIAADGTRRLYVRLFDAVTAHAIDGTEGAQYPFWSPDGHSIGFFAGGKVKRIAEAGGAAQVLCDVKQPLGGAWTADRTILFGSGAGPIMRVAETGGVPTPITAVDKTREEQGHGWPVSITGTRRLLYLARSSAREHTGVYESSFDSAEKHRLLTAESSIGAIGTNLFWFSNGSLLTQTYQAARMQLVGEPITVADHIALDSPLRSGGAFAVADDVIAYRNASPDSRLIWFDRSGKEIGEFPMHADYQNPWLSNDEKHVAIEKTDAATGRHTIWMVDLLRGVTSRLLYDPAGAHGPAWSPDGARVAFNSNRLGGIDLFSMRADGAGEQQLLLSSENPSGFVLNDWSRDGRLLLFQAGPRQNDLWTMPVSPLGDPKPFVETAANERHGRFSPDVQWVAYSSDESGVPEVYVRRFPEGDGKWRISTRGGAQPRWRRDGKELIYLAPDGKLMAADVTSTRATFQASEPHALFSTGITTSIVDRTNNYVATGDAQRFLVNLGAEDESFDPITVVVNWRQTLPAAVRR